MLTILKKKKVMFLQLEKLDIDLGVKIINSPLNE